MTTITTEHEKDTLKSLRETLCRVQTLAPVDIDRERIQRLIDDIDRQRPLGPDGKALASGNGDLPEETIPIVGKIDRELAAQITHGEPNEEEDPVLKLPEVTVSRDAIAFTVPAGWCAPDGTAYDIWNVPKLSKKQLRKELDRTRTKLRDEIRRHEKTRRKVKRLLKTVERLAGVR